MVDLATSQEWQTQTARLLQARPTTTRITTKYNIPNLDSEQYQKKLSRKRKRDGEETNTEAAKVPQATLELKTYDPVSGVVLKFKTNRAAEVGRLVLSLGNLGRYMAALPVKDEVQDTVMEDATAVEQAAEDTKDAVPATSDAKPQQTAGGGGGAGGNKKKKKGKK